MRQKNNGGDTTAGEARLARWEQEEALGQPLWEEVGVFLQTLGCESVAIAGLFAELAQTVPQLPQVMAACGVDEALIAQVQPRIAAVSERLQAYKP